MSGLDGLMDGGGWGGGGVEEQEEEACCSHHYDFDCLQLRATQIRPAAESDRVMCSSAARC